MIIRKFLFALLIVAVAAIAAPGWESPANAEAVNLPTLDEFAAELHSANGLAGVYSEGIFALPVVRQPSGNPGFVSSQPGVVTDFSMAHEYDTIGLLAHNTLAGAEFDHLAVGQTLTLVYSNGERNRFRVTAVERYQALSPHNTRSDFISLSNPNQRMTATDLFNHVYAPGNRLVLQTCIANYGNPSWGRLFIIAQPLPSFTLSISTYDPMPSWYMGGSYYAR